MACLTGACQTFLTLLLSASGQNSKSGLLNEDDTAGLLHAVLLSWVGNSPAPKSGVVL
jgi:hypothetical protein